MQDYALNFLPQILYSNLSNVLRFIGESRIKRDNYIIRNQCKNTKWIVELMQEILTSY